MSNYVVIGGCGGANSDSGSSDPATLAGEVRIFKNNMVPADYQKMSPIIDALAQPNYVDVSMKKGNFLQNVTGDARFGYNFASFTDRGVLSPFLCSYQSVKSNKVGACAEYDYLTAVMHIETSAQSTLSATTLRLKVFGTKYSDGSHTLIASALNASCESFEISDDGNFIYFAKYNDAYGTYFVKMNLLTGAITSLATIPVRCKCSYIKRLDSDNMILVCRIADDATNVIDSNIYKYNITLNTFTLLSTRPSSRVSGHTILVNDKVYFFGGANKSSFSSAGIGSATDAPNRSYSINNFDIYDITNNTWVQKTLPYNLRGSNGAHYRGGVLLLPNDIIAFVKDSIHNTDIAAVPAPTATLQFGFYNIQSDTFTYSNIMYVNNYLKLGGSQSGMFEYSAPYTQTCAAGGLFLDKDGALCFFSGASNQPYVYTSKVYEDFSNNNVAAYKKSV